jgi:uncharacterized membrane protein YjjB (DUF3815 family)
MVDAIQLLHQSVFGALAAAGFGVLFNVSSRTLPWCTALGALALGVRTLSLQNGLRLESASFLAALAVGSAVQILQHRFWLVGNPVAVAGCVPMVPGALAAKGILGLVAVTAANAPSPTATLVTAVQDTLRVTLTIVALGTGVAIPTLLFSPKQRSAKHTGSEGDEEDESEESD